MQTIISVSILKRFVVTGTLMLGDKTIHVDTYMVGYSDYEACADAAWGAGLKELRGTGVLLTDRMYTYELTATEDKSL